MKRTKKSDRCTGHCCRTFTLPFSPEQLQDAYRRWHNRGSEPIYKAGVTPADTFFYRDIWLIAPMVTYLGFFDESPMKRVNPTDSQLLKRPDEGAHYYSCKHFDHKGKVCTIYEIRPEVCRAYPYGKKCEYAGCTWTSHKAKKETRSERAKRLRELKENDKAKIEPGGETKGPTCTSTTQ